MTEYFHPLPASVLRTPLSCVAELFGVRTQKGQLEQLSDQFLVSQLLAGRQEAFEPLLRKYQKLVYNVLFQMVANHETAADLTQETFLKVYRGLHSFNRKANFKTWLMKIATNTGLNWLRDNKNTASLEALLELNPALEPVGNDNLEEDMDRQLTQQKLNQVLSVLSARQRHIFLLRYQHDFSYEEISQITGETQAAIKSVLFRVRDKIRIRDKIESGDDQ